MAITGGLDKLQVVFRHVHMHDRIILSALQAVLFRPSVSRDALGKSAKNCKMLKKVHFPNDSGTPGAIIANLDVFIVY